MSDLAIAVLAGLPILVATVLAVVEVVRRADLTVTRRVAWLVVLVFVPVVGVAVYALVRPLRTPTATMHDDTGPSDAERLVVAAEQRQRGEIDDAEFRRIAAELNVNRTQLS